MKKWLQKWLGIPSLADVRKEFSDALLSKPTSPAVKPSRMPWATPHAPISEFCKTGKAGRQLQIAKEHLNKLSKQDQVALDVWEDEIWERCWKESYRKNPERKRNEYQSNHVR